MLRNFQKSWVLQQLSTRRQATRLFSTEKPGTPKTPQNQPKVDPIGAKTTPEVDPKKTAQTTQQTVPPPNQTKVDPKPKTPETEPKKTAETSAQEAARKAAPDAKAKSPQPETKKNPPPPPPPPPPQPNNAAKANANQATAGKRPHEEGHKHKANKKSYNAIASKILL